MKKILFLLLAVLMALTLVACNGAEDEVVDGENNADVETNGDAVEGESDAAEGDDPFANIAVMSYDEYIAAELDTPVVVETYVQAKQSWWDNKATVYTQDENGGYFLYNMTCSEEDYAKLVEGTKIRVKGYKAAFSGEVEIIDSTFEIIDGTYVSEAVNANEIIGAANVIDYQNKRVAFTGMTVEASQDANGEEHAFLYGWDGSGQEGSDSDLYFNASVNGNTYTFVIEYYLCGADSDAYKAVQNLSVGDVIDMEGFMYWYEGPQPHIYSVTAAE